MKQRKPWIATLVLIGILALLAAYIFLVEAKREPPLEEAAVPTPAPLWEFGSDDLVKITATRRGETSSIERSDEGWRMTAPKEKEGETDSARVDSMVSQVANIKFTRAMADVSDPADFGLQEPDMQVTLVFSDGTVINLDIGDKNPRHTDYYMQKEGDPLVYLVPINVVDGLLRLAWQPSYYLPPAPTSVPSPVDM